MTSLVWIDRRVCSIGDLSRTNPGCWDWSRRMTLALTPFAVKDDSESSIIAGTFSPGLLATLARWFSTVTSYLSLRTWYACFIMHARTMNSIPVHPAKFLTSHDRRRFAIRDENVISRIWEEIDLTISSPGNWSESTMESFVVLDRPVTSWSMLSSSRNCLYQEHQPQ